MKLSELRCLMHQFRGLVILPGLFCFWQLAVESVYASEKTDLLELSTSHAPSLLLLKSYEKGRNVDGWLVSEKLDGVRAYWDGHHLISRQGNVFQSPEWFTKKFPPFELDGELWLGRSRFEETVSIVRRKEPHEGWRKLTYQIFEVPNQKGGLLERLQVLKDFLNEFPSTYIQIIPQVRVDSEFEVDKRLKAVLVVGGEGIVLRNPDMRYEAGRSDSALKVKSKDDAECLITGYTEGKGKYQGQVGSVLCRLLDGQFKALRTVEDRTIRIGSGLSDAQRKNPPVVGTVVTFQHSGMTKRGLPRFPVFWRVRKDWNKSENRELNQQTE